MAAAEADESLVGIQGDGDRRGMAVSIRSDRSTGVVKSDAEARDASP